MINYTLTRSNRKTIAIYVRDGEIEVRAPLRAAKRDIDRIVESNEKWIQKKLAASTERLSQRDNFTLAYGDYITCRGKQYPIAARCGDRIGFDEERFYMPAGLSPEEIKSACIQIYRMLAKRDLTERVYRFAEQMQVYPTAVKINGAKTRWGSCSSKKSLNFSWLLIMADDDVIDYVIVHELAHITQMNHSAKFWAIVEDVLPDYKERKMRLKDLQKKQSMEDWREV